VQPSTETSTGRILVVDDTEMNRDMLARRLQRRGYEVAVAENGRMALEMVEAGDFDLVLLDIMMPEVNGYEVLERLKADRALRHIPVVMISAVSEMESIVRCIKLGAADYLPKPFDATLLQARVESSLAVKRLYDREHAYARSLERELEIGRAIQQGFLPDELPVAPGWDLAARFRPARQVAGDFYDAFPMAGPDGARPIGLVVADVCDKGVGAALFMALFRSLLRAGAQSLPPDVSDKGLLRVVSTVNDYIATTHDRANMFATVFFSVLDPPTCRLRYVNAGHDAPLVVGHDGRRRRLEPTGPALGLMPGVPFAVETLDLASGDTLAAFTDGVVDAQSHTGAFFTEARLLDLLAAPAPTVEAVLDTVDAALAAHTEGAEPFDDITLLAARCLG
jgi:phosphoserine phosphatase RsbU/P